MNDEAIVDKQDIVVDMTGFNKSVEDQFKIMKNKMEEMLTPVEQATSLTESKASAEDTPFDYRIGVAKWLSNEMESPTSLREERNKYVKIDTNTNAKDGERALRDVFTIKESVSDRGKTTDYVLRSNAQASLTEAIGSVNPDCCIPEVWADDVERTHVYPGSVFWGAWFLRWERGIENQPGDKVWICTVGTAMATTIAAACTEPTTVGATIECPYITLTDYACAYYMCKNDIESVQPDLITELNAGLADCLNRQIDNYFFDVARTDDCTAGTLLSGSAMSGSLIAEAMGSMRNGTYEPVVLITHPVSMSSLLQDTNFVYACRYGNRDVITGGRVLEWLNLQILMVPKGTLSVGGGSYDSLLLAKNAIAAAIKHGLRVESEYSVIQQRRYVLATIKFGGTCLHPSGIWWIRSKDD